uniref:Uncharacterized protein MANES_05G000500 n=1 Tax=Rhizophora mucronata TaxID=61149 RepID=A0A2P2L6V4_RHIMU
MFNQSELKVISVPQTKTVRSEHRSLQFNPSHKKPKNRTNEIYHHHKLLINILKYGSTKILYKIYILNTN